MIKIGDIIAERYEIQDKIGAGGMSDVYRAYDSKLNRPVAVKVLKQEFSDNADFLSKFRVEAQAAAGLMHPNIVNVYDVGEEYGSHYMIMELVEGITLKRYIEKKQRLSVKEAVSIAIQVANGIESAHNNHIIHRDIKPQNIIISKDGKVKVTDFGIAKAATSNTITSNVMGSVHYTSPEQVRGGFSDEKSDIYSLGITLFEMLTGRVPFNGDTTVAVAIKHIQEPMPTPRDYVAEIPISVEQIVMKCTQKSADRRYQVVPELIEDLKRSLISPDEDFVRIESPESSGKTKNIDGDELERIKRARSGDMSNSAAIATSGSATGKVVPLRTVEEQYEEYEEYEEVDEDFEPYEEEDIKPLPRKVAEERTTSAKKASVSGKKNGKRKNDEDYNPKMELLVTVLIVAVAVVIGLIALFFLGKAMGLFGKKDGSTSDNEVQQETVVSTNDQTGTREDVVDANSVVLVSYVGLAKPEAVAQLNAAGLTEIIEEVDAEEPMGTVVGMSPEWGTTVARGSSVTLYISNGSGNSSGITVPNLLSGGMTESDAVITLTELGFVPVSDGEEYSETCMEGEICYQSVPAFSKAPAGTEIHYKVSKGPEAAMYSCNYNVAAPADYAGGTATIVMTGSDGSQLFNQTTESFPVTISISGLKGVSYGDVVITYEVAQNQEVTDADGNVTIGSVMKQQITDPIRVEFTRE